MRIQNWSKVGALVIGVARRTVGLHDARPLYAGGADRRARSARPSSERRRAPPWASSRAIARWSARSARSSARGSAPWPAPASAPTWTARKPSCGRSSSGPASASRAIGDNITLNMPGNITFATNSADLNANFFDVLNSVSMVRQRVRPDGHRGRGPYRQHGRRRRTTSSSPSAARSAVAAYLGTRSVLHGPHHHGRHGRRPAGRDQRHGRRPPAEPPRRAHARPADAELDLGCKNGEGRTVRHGAPFFFRPRIARLGRGELLLELRDRVGLDLADALRRDAVLRRELVQRGLAARPASAATGSCGCARRASPSAAVSRSWSFASAVVALDGLRRIAVRARQIRRPARNPRRPRDRGRTRRRGRSSRCSISATSRVVTPRSAATASASSLLSQPRCFLALRRLKNSLRWAFVVATRTRRQLRSTNSWISARIQWTANETRRTPTFGSKRRTAFMRPMLPSWIRSPSCKP